MGINITILIQIVNFLIAYVIIRTLLLKPVVTVILNQEAHQEELNLTLQNLEKGNQAKEAILAQDWESCKKEFKEHAPKIQEAQKMLEQPTPENLPEIPAIDKKTIEPMTNQVADQISERLSHVR
jgi:hypothetical protein